MASTRAARNKRANSLSVIASEAKQSRGRSTTVWVAGAAPVVAPGLLTWGFSRQGLISVFHVVGFLMWRRRGLDGQRAPSSSWKPVFSGGSGLSRGEARRRRRAWRALDGPEPPEVSRT